MKRTVLFLACASLFAMGALAQQTAEELFKEGKAALEKYDKMSAAFQMEQAKNPEAKNANAAEMTDLLFEGFTKLNQALPLDTIIEVDKKTGEPKIDKKTGKPKFKAKLSPEIIVLLEGHQNDFLNVGNDNLKAENWNNSYRAFSAFSKMKEAKGAIPEEQKALMGEVSFFEGYSAYQIKDYRAAKAAFVKADKYGYKENPVLDFANSCTANVIQGYVDNKDYSGALQYIDSEIAANPSAFIYDMKGSVIEAKLESENASLPDNKKVAPYSQSRQFFAKAVEIEPNNATAIFDLANTYHAEASDIIQNNTDKSTEQIAPQVKPLLEKCLPMLKKAKELKPDVNSRVDYLIENTEYNLNILNGKQ